MVFSGCGAEKAEEPVDKWDFVRIVWVSKVTAFGLWVKLREVQRIYVEGGLVVPGTVVEVLMLAESVVDTSVNLFFAEGHMNVMEELK